MTFLVRKVVACIEDGGQVAVVPPTARDGLDLLEQVARAIPDEVTVLSRTRQKLYLKNGSVVGVYPRRSHSIEGLRADLYVVPGELLYVARHLAALTPGATVLHWERV